MNAPQGVSDAARRAAYEVTLHATMGNAGKWVALPLADDGTCDHIAYDTRASAIQHQKRGEQYYAYVKVPADGMPLEDADAYMKLQRKVYDQGFRFTDPDGPSIVLPHTKEGLRSALRDVSKLRLGYSK